MSWWARAASQGHAAARVILDSDLEQAIMVLTTLVAAVTYGWIEGFVIVGTRPEATQVWWFLGHFSTYSLSMALLFGCITGGFGLVKGASMFKHGKRFFLITFAGNYPFSWMVEDFSFFWFYPDFRLTSTAWTNWFLGGVWLLDPWRTNIGIWIPTWYFLVSAFWVAMMWWAHRCTVLDALAKDQEASKIPPEDLSRLAVRFPHLFVKKAAPVAPVKRTDAPYRSSVPIPRPTTARSPAAERALRELQEKMQHARK